MTMVYAEHKAQLQVRRECSRGALLAWAMLAGPLALICGCAGLASGNNAKTPAPVTPQTHGISGTLSPTTGGAGATVSLSGAISASTTASNTGAYAFGGLSNGNYAVTPSQTGYTFTPGTQSVTINGTDVTGVNFTANAQTAPTFSISGTISPTTGGAGATVTLSGAAAATTSTSNSGNYSFPGLANGNYTITPTNTGFSFSPASQSVTISGMNITGTNFTATTQATHSVALTWAASPTTGVTSYNIYRSTVSGSLFARVGSTQASIMSYTDATVANGTTYYYVATAVDTNGESVFSNQVSAVIP